jgi:hypothetical protein
MTGIDRVTEATSRWLAKRTSRRSFLGNVGKVAVVTAGGSAVAGLFAQQAQARVCGQTGVSPKCPTYDCVQPGFFGYCWYASPGCCANGGLKKICDCCLTGWPNVQGYCPDGASVYCVVESCLEDPRVQTVTLDRWGGDNPVTASVARSAVRPGSPTVVIGSAAHPLAAALATPVASELGVPVLFCPTDRIPAEVVAEIARLGAKRFVLAAPGLADSARATLDGLGTTEQLIPTAGPEDWAGASVEVARWLVERGPRTELVVLGADGEALAIAPAAAAFAAARRGPVLVGPDAVLAVRDAFPARTFNVTAIGNAVRGTVSGAKDVVAANPEVLSLVVADLVLGRDTGTLSIGFTPVTAGGFGGIVASSSVVVVHAEGVFSERVRDWVVERRRRFTRAETCLHAPGALDNVGVYRAQSALNGFDAHQLAGYGGDGLPVYPQPLEERVIGQARVTGSLPSTSRPPKPVRTDRPEDRFPVRTVVMPPPTSWPPGTTTTPLPPASESTTRPPRPNTSGEPKK